MAHSHVVADSDKHFKIDPLSRKITNESDKIRIVQGDHNSERFTFEIPRVIEGHDMSLCNSVQVHYLNIQPSTRTTTGKSSAGLYGVDDLTISPEDENVLLFSWLISGNSTKYNGVLSFIIKFTCTDTDGTVEYAFNTATFSDIEVIESIDNTGAIQPEKYVDIIAQWEASLSKIQRASITDDRHLILYMSDNREIDCGIAKGERGNGIQKAEQTETSKESAGVNRFVFTMTDGETYTLEVRNGEKGEKGDAAVIESVTAVTGEPGSEASAVNEGTTAKARIRLTIPQGEVGKTPEIAIGTVETVASDKKAAATVTGTAEKPELNLKIPKGNTGQTPNLSVGTVETVAPDEPASASMTGTAEKPVLNLRIPKGSVGDGEVDPDKTTWMRRVYYNIFDKSTILDGYEYPMPVPSNPLQLNKNDECFVSDFIPVRQNTRYIVGGYNVPKGYGNYIVLKFFDKDKAYLGYQYGISIDTKMFTTPESTAFLRFSQRKGNGTADEIYLYEYINEIFPYTEYKTEYKILTCDDNYCDMIRDINTWDLLEKARLFVDDNKGVLSDEALKSGYWSILRMAGYTNIRGQLNRERMITNVGTLFFYPKEDAVIPKKVVFGLKPDEYFAINSEGSTLPEGGSAYNCEKYAGITDLILEYDGEYNKDFSMNVYPLKMLQNSLETLVLDKKGSIGMWSICLSNTLRKVVLYGKEKPFAYATFSYCPNLKSLHFPTGCADMVNQTICWQTVLDDFTIGENYTGAIYLNGVLLATNPRITEILHKLIENLADLTSYTLTAQEPSDWSTNYTNYYTEADGVYTKVTGETAPTWAENTYYSKNTGKVFCVGTALIEKIDEEHKLMLETKNWNLQ